MEAETQLLDWTLELSKYSKITLIHRRNQFRGAKHTLNEIKQLEKEGKIRLKHHSNWIEIEGKSELNQFQ